MTVCIDCCARKIISEGIQSEKFLHKQTKCAGLGVGGGFLENSVALVNTADEAMEFRPCWHISLPCNCDFGRPPPLDQRDFLYVVGITFELYMLFETKKCENVESLVY